MIFISVTSRRFNQITFKSFESTKEIKSRLSKVITKRIEEIISNLFCFTQLAFGVIVIVIVNVVVIVGVVVVVIVVVDAVGRLKIVV